MYTQQLRKQQAPYTWPIFYNSQSKYSTEPALGTRSQGGQQHRCVLASTMSAAPEDCPDNSDQHQGSPHGTDRKAGHPPRPTPKPGLLKPGKRGGAAAFCQVRAGPQAQPSSRSLDEIRPMLHLALAPNDIGLSCSLCAHSCSTAKLSHSCIFSACTTTTLVASSSLLQSADRAVGTTHTSLRIFLLQIGADIRDLTIARQLLAAFVVIARIKSHSQTVHTEKAPISRLQARASSRATQVWRTSEAVLRSAEEQPKSRLVPESLESFWILCLA